ncbi:hypothetical protein MFLO_08512 [Listeria floridensis FSL S10-1187]|uniref:Aldehyde dehydrogenase domain-containing protein n=1 Tax=Listeria floridensis FSL S10-1187 TaxID=1265817 RepID=A0ABN0RFD1_9LIST|nr:hypothetical protein MFLO_08512 [Listeria floridensis FSL S10-1187]
MAFGKFANAGQTCIAPDYAFVHEQIYEAFKSEVRQAIQDFYGKDPLQSEAYGRIVNVSHFERLKSYVPEARVNEAELKIEPCLLDAPDPDSPVMQDEIFGPILPIYPYSKIEEVIAFINARPKPLALYLFTTNRQLERQVLFETSSGGVCINDTLMHIAGTYLPFGGVGESGMGSYHGYQNFRTFSHERSVLRQTSLFDFKFRYPGAKNAEKILRFVFK